MISLVHLLALAFKAKTTLRLKELAWLAVGIGGVFIALGASSRNPRQGPQIAGGLAIAAGAVIAILAFHYGK